MKIKFFLFALSLVLALALPNCGTEQDFGHVELAEEMAASSLGPNAFLSPGQYLTSPNGQYRFYLQDDGNLVLRTWPNENVSWASGTNGRGGTRFIFQSDGNLVLYTSSNSPVWASNTMGSGATVLQLNDNGSLVLYRGTTVVWSKGGGTPPPPPPPPPGGSVTIAVIGDSQVLSESSSGGSTFVGMMQWLVNNRQSLNLAFVASVGDMTEVSASSEWSRIKAGYNVLRNAGIPYAPCKGNHDGTSGINSTFPVSGTPGLSGSMSGGIENAYYLFTAGGMSFVHVVTQEPYSSSAANWANTIFARYSTRRGIFATHNIQPGSGIQTGVVQRNNNIFMAVTGHDCRNNGEAHWTSRAPNGSTQHLMLTDYQCRSNGGAYIRLYTLNPNTDQVCAKTYNYTARSYETDGDSQFCFSYNMVHLPCALSDNGVCPGDGMGEYTCTDSLNFIDAQGYQCSDWVGFDCDRAAEDWNYTEEQEEYIKLNCENSCNLCFL